MKANTYKQRRNRLAETMNSSSILILAGNTGLERTNDVAYPFRQSSNFLYLTGVNQPDAVLVLHKGQSNVITEELYITQLHPFMAAWEGRSNKIDELQQISGIKDIKEYKKSPGVLSELLTNDIQIVYLDTPDTSAAQIAAWWLWDQIKEMKPDLEITSINPALNDLRVTKDDEEVKLIQEAIHQTDLALQHVQPLLVPGVTEREIAAEFIKFATVKGYDQSWPPVISFGKNSVVIHHTPDDTRLQEGDFVLFDVGIEVEGYSSDISRMVVPKHSTDRQEEVLEAVKSVQADAIALMKPGIKFNEFEEQAAQIMAQKLVDLGLFMSLEEANSIEGELQWPAYRRYFNHYTSHYLGLDAHDVGDRDIELAPGMVLTCEPGIYIAEEGIGVRIEDDILITEDGNRNLSEDVQLNS